MMSHAMNYADRFAQGLAYLRADLPILIGRTAAR
jgi:hypothetical protein